MVFERLTQPDESVWEHLLSYVIGMFDSVAGLGRVLVKAYQDIEASYVPSNRRIGECREFTLKAIRADQGPPSHPDAAGNPLALACHRLIARKPKLSLRRCRNTSRPANGGSLGLVRTLPGPDQTLKIKAGNDCEIVYFNRAGRFPPSIMIRRVSPLTDNGTGAVTPGLRSQPRMLHWESGSRRGRSS